jgi:hypothetical protein
MSPDDRLRFVIAKDDPDAVRRALRDVGDVNAPLPDSSGATVLHEAAEAHALSAVRLLLEAGANVDARDAFGNTPLHYALFDRTDDDDVSRALRAAGADPALAADQHPEAFDGQSAIVAYDETGVVLRRRPDGLLEALTRPWADTYHPGSNDDWEHVFSELPGPLMIPVVLAWQIGRVATGSAGEPVQLAAIKLNALPDPFPEPGAPGPDGEDFDRLGTLVRLPVRDILEAVRAGSLADVETAALLFAVVHELEHGV